jgi:hypothetical protein
LCTYYQLTVTKAGVWRPYVFYDDHHKELNRIWVTIRWTRDSFTSDDTSVSEHLIAFTRSYPVCMKSEYCWSGLCDEVTTDLKKKLERTSQSSTPRLYADYLFSLLVSALFHRKHINGLALVRLTQEAYEKSTALLHHRLPLLTRLNDYLTQNRRPLRDERPAFPSLTPDVLKKSLAKGQPNVFHAFKDREDVTAEHRTARRVQEFALATMRDCLEDFAGQDGFQSTEKFCRYLRNRDECAPVWLENGLLCMRFHS